MTMDDYRHKLIAKILVADSHYEVKRYCSAAIKELERQQLHGYLILRFVEKTVNELSKFSPMYLDAQPWSNIDTARVQYRRVLRQYAHVHE